MSRSKLLAGKHAIAKLLVLAFLAAFIVWTVNTWRAIENNGEISSTNIARAADGMATQARLVRSLNEKSASLFDQRIAALARVDALQSQLEPAPIGCQTLIPNHEHGAGILQVANVLANRGDDTRKFSATQATRLRTLVQERGVKTWANHLSYYLGRGKKPVWRVVFNNISPAAGAEMCAWLRCEKWTGGCAFIDEEGETHPSEAPKLETPTGEVVPSEYAPSEDLYAMWKAG